MQAQAVTLEDLQSAIFRDQVMQARRMTEQERFRAGLEQGDFALGMMLSGVRLDYPEADHQEACRVLRQRLGILRRLEDHGLFIPAEAA